MELVFISGPYRAKTIAGVVSNIRAAEMVALKYWEQGFAVICPHKNTALLDGTLPDEIWLKGDLEMLKRCDYIVMMAGWYLSEGASAERLFAIERGIPVIYDDLVKLK